MANNLKSSKLARRQIYDYVEKIAGRKLEEFELIHLSKFVRSAIQSQTQVTCGEMKKMGKALRSNRLKLIFYKKLVKKLSR